MKKTWLFAALLFAISSAVADMPLHVSDADEIRAGNVLASEFIQQQGIGQSPQTAKIEQYLQKVGDKVAAHAKRRLPYTFHFDPDPTFRSAVGLPGGQVFIGAGIIAYMDTEDQLAAVLAHEVEHIDMNQCHDRLVKVLTEQQLSMAQINRLKVDDFLPGYGHDNERAADLEGAKLAAAAGYSPVGMMRLLKTFVILNDQMRNASVEGRKSLEERITQLDPLVKVAGDVKERPLEMP